MIFCSHDKVFITLVFFLFLLGIFKKSQRCNEIVYSILKKSVIGALAWLLGFSGFTVMGISSSTQIVKLFLFNQGVSQAFLMRSHRWRAVSYYVGWCKFVVQGI